MSTVKKALASKPAPIIRYHEKRTPPAVEKTGSCGAKCFKATYGKLCGNCRTTVEAPWTGRP